MSWIKQQTLAEIRARMAQVRAGLAPRIEQGRQWLITPRDPLSWAHLRVRGTRLIHLLSSTYGGRFAVGAGITFAAATLLIGLAFWGGAVWSRGRELWRWYQGEKSPNEAIAPIFTLAAALVVAAITLMRHFVQTEADRQRRITESFSKAVEQLAHKDTEFRLGGIYTLERISKESPDDYWTVMETLTAFVRERTRPEAERLEKPLEQRKAERAHRLWEEAGKPEGRSKEFWNKAVVLETFGEPPAADIAAVLTVIRRRSEDPRELERALDFRKAVLRQADLAEARLSGADFYLAHLEGAFLVGAHLEGAELSGAHLECANLSGARFKGAGLYGAHLEGALLIQADLTAARDLSQAQIDSAFGDKATGLPEKRTRPPLWTDPWMARWRTAPWMAR